MSAPVIVDDGGSTRLKLILPAGVGAMDSLLEVGPLAAVPGVPLPAGTVGSQHRINDPYTNILIMIQDSTGRPFTIPPNPATPAPFANFEITSGDQRVRGDIVAGPALILTVFSPAGNDPIVDAKQHKKKRRYVVSNAPPIDQVRINGVAVPLPAGVTLPIVYSSIVLT